MAALSQPEVASLSLQNAAYLSQLEAVLRSAAQTAAWSLEQALSLSQIEKELSLSIALGILC